jgi:hypothetical protein
VLLLLHLKLLLLLLLHLKQLLVLVLTLQVGALARLTPLVVLAPPRELLLSDLPVRGAVGRVEVFGLLRDLLVRRGHGTLGVAAMGRVREVRLHRRGAARARARRRG